MILHHPVQLKEEHLKRPGPTALLGRTNIARTEKAPSSRSTGNKARMNYHEHIANGWPPIGSSPVEAACKTIVKARLCHSGMRWNREGGSTSWHYRRSPNPINGITSGTDTTLNTGRMQPLKTQKSDFRP